MNSLIKVFTRFGLLQEDINYHHHHPVHARRMGSVRRWVPVEMAATKAERAAEEMFPGRPERAI